METKIGHYLNRLILCVFIGEGWLILISTIYGAILATHPDMDSVGKIILVLFGICSIIPTAVVWHYFQKLKDALKTEGLPV